MKRLKNFIVGISAVVMFTIGTMTLTACTKDDDGKISVSQEEYDNLLNNQEDGKHGDYTEDEYLAKVAALAETEATLTATYNEKVEAEMELEAYKANHNNTDAKYDELEARKNVLRSNYEQASADYNAKVQELTEYKRTHLYTNDEYNGLQEELSFVNGAGHLVAGGKLETPVTFASGETTVIWKGLDIFTSPQDIYDFLGYTNQEQIDEFLAKQGEANAKWFTDTSENQQSFVSLLNSTHATEYKCHGFYTFNLPQDHLDKFLLLVGDDMGGTRNAFTPGAYIQTITSGTLVLQLVIVINSDGGVSYTISQIV